MEQSRHLFDNIYNKTRIVFKLTYKNDGLFISNGKRGSMMYQNRGKG